MRRLAIGLGLLGLACTSLSALGVGLLLQPITTGRLGYYALIAGGSSLRLAGLALIGCLLALPAALRPSHPRWLPRAALALGAMSAAVSTVMSAWVLVAAQAQGRAVSLGDSLFEPRIAAGAEPEVVTFASGAGWHLDADLYRPNGQGARAAAVVVVHGGAWTAGDKGENPTWNRWLVERGYVVLDIQYRLAPAATWPEQVDDIGQAMAWLQRNADNVAVDPDRIALLGRSAGGHLVLLAAFAGDSSGRRPPWRVVAFYAPSDLTRLYAETGGPSADDLRGDLGALIGAAPSENREAYQLASPLERVHAGLPPTLLVHGGWDSVVPPDHSQRLALALEGVGARVELIGVPFARHAFDLMTYGPATMLAREAVIAFLAD